MGPSVPRDEPQPRRISPALRRGALGIAAATLAAVLITTGCQRQPTNASNSTSTATQTPAITASSTPSHDGHDDANLGRPNTTPALARAVDAALTFARAWVHRERPPGQWLAAVAPLCTTEFARELQTVDPANIPADTVTATPTLHTNAGATVTYRVATNAGTLLVSLSVRDTGWKVSSLNFQRSVTR